MPVNGDDEIKGVINFGSPSCFLTVVVTDVDGVKDLLSVFIQPFYLFYVGIGCKNFLKISFNRL